MSTEYCPYTGICEGHDIIVQSSDGTIIVSQVDLERDWRAYASWRESFAKMLESLRNAE